MFGDAENKLLSAAPTGFPLVDAAAASLQRCTTCGHANVNIHSMLRVAVNKYKSDKNFIEYCARLFKLPCSVAGVLITKE